MTDITQISCELTDTTQVSSKFTDITQVSSKFTDITQIFCEMTNITQISGVMETHKTNKIIFYCVVCTFFHVSNLSK